MRQLGPESPHYVEVPQPPQKNQKPRQVIKGVLPVPRNVFPQGRMEKVTEEYISKTIPEPSDGRDEKALSERIAWKGRMAEARKKNFREGLRELQYRAAEARDKRLRREKKINTLRDTMLFKPEPMDEQLTSPTEMQMMRALLEKKRVLSDFEKEARESRLRKAIENVAERKARESEERVEHLRNLYVNATHFITNNKQLEDAVEKAFGTQEEPATFGKSKGPSIWYEGIQSNLQDRLNYRARMSSSPSENSEERANLAEKRLRKISEMLLGDPDKLASS